jgi:sugar phosphate isomerase/epimerase
MILACQENHLPGKGLEAKWEFAQEAGFDGIELLGGAGFGERLPELRAARDAGVVFASVCVSGPPFIGDFDADVRTQAIARVDELLSAIGELGGRGAVSPAAYGIFSANLPPYRPPRPAEEDREVLLEALTALGATADAAGVALFLEPLNRYEDHMLNRVEQAVELCEAVGGPALQVMADTYHMNIEEADPVATVRNAGPRLTHVHISDSNRYEPGAGHVDFPGILGALRERGFEGTLAFEGRLSGPAPEVLPRMAAYVRSCWDG